MGFIIAKIPSFPACTVQPALLRPTPRRSIAAHATGSRIPKGQEANSVLDAFFLGKAVAETINEKLGAALGEILSEITKANAERDYAWRSFQQEVQQRADREKESRTGISLGAFPTSTTSAPQPVQMEQPRGVTSQSTTGWRSQSQALRDSRGSAATDEAAQQQIDLQELADDLRADIASARANLQQLKLEKAAPVTDRQIRGVSGLGP